MAIGSGGPWRLYASFQGKNKDIIKTGQGSVMSAIAENRSAEKIYLQLFDQFTSPAASEVPIICVPMFPGGGGFVLDQDLWGPEGHGFATGIAFGFSTTVAEFTAGTTDATLQLWYW